MGEPARTPLQRASALIGRLRSSVERCEPCAFQIRDVHNAIIASLKPLVEAQQLLLQGGGRCVAALREVQLVAGQGLQQAASMQRDIDASRSTQELAAELAAALQRLKAQPVDPLFIGGEAGHTLYDFVDESSVHGLQQQLQGELSEMEAIYRSCHATVSSFDQQMRYLNGLLGAVMPVVYPSGAEDTSAVDAVGVLMTAIKQRCSLPAVDTVEMMPLQVLMQGWKTYAMELEVSVVSLASSVSQVENIQTRLLALRDRAQHQSGLIEGGNSVSSPHGSSASTDTASDRTEEELRHMLTELESCERTALERIRVGDSLAQSWESRMQEYNVIRWCARGTKNLQDSALQRIRGAALECDRIIQATRERRAPFDDGIRRFAVLKQSVDSLRQELTSLSYFYQEFATAYVALQEEMKRRHDAVAALKRTVEQAEAALRAYSASEADSRRRFLEQYGQFLPVSLCPEVQDPAPVFEIVPSIEEVLRRIPVPSARPLAATATATAAAAATATATASSSARTAITTTPSLGDEPPAALQLPIVKGPANELKQQAKHPQTDADSKTEAETSAADTLHQPKPRRVLQQSSLYGSDLPSTTVFSPSPTARGPSSPFEAPPFAISPVANPLPDLLQLIESLDGSRPFASSDKFHFSDDLPGAQSDSLPPLPVTHAVEPATRDERNEQKKPEGEDGEGNDWVHF